MIPINDVPAIHGGKPIFDSKFRFIEPFLPPWQQVISEYERAYASGLITNANVVARLEAAVAERLRVKHCVAVSSCTSGLMLVLRALGLTGEVILPSFTFFATGHAVRWNGLTPVLADCDPDTWNIDTVDLERNISERTSAILAVHLYGNPANVKALESIATRRGVKLIFDSAHAFGSVHDGEPVGCFGDAEVFSMSPTKLLVAGEGGLVTTNDAKLASAVRTMRNYGDSGSYNPEWVGLNARLSEFNAALALAGLGLMEQKIKRRRDIATVYTEALSSLPGVSFQKVRAGDIHTFKDYSIHVEANFFGMSRDGLVNALAAENIETKKYFWPPLHLQDIYRPFQIPGRSTFTNTEYITGGIVSLPIYEALPDNTIDGISRAITRIANFERGRKSVVSKGIVHHANSTTSL